MKKHILIVVVVLSLIVLLFWRSGSDAPPSSRAYAVAVRTGFVEESVVASQLNTVGSTEALMDVDITTERTGKVSAIHFSANQSIERGQLLVELDSAVERAALQEANVTVAEERRVLAHYEQLIRTRAVSQTVLDEQKAKVAAVEARLAATEAALSKFSIKAPFSGVLGFRLISPGTLVEPGDRITTLDAIDILKVEFTAPESWIGRLNVGDSLTAVSVAYPDREFKATVFAVGNRVDTVTRAVTLKAKIDNKERLLKPGMSLEVALDAPSRKVLLIDEEALLQEGSRRFVFVVKDNDTVEQRPVETGVRQEGKVEVVSGLNAGESIVTEGVQKIRPGSQVKVLEGDNRP